MLFRSRPGSVIEVELLRVHERPEEVLEDRLASGRIIGQGPVDGGDLLGPRRATEDPQEQLVDDLGRIGPVEVHLVGPDPLEPLDEDQRDLLMDLATGATVAAAASARFLSLRTAERRLAQARRALGVRTTAEAVALARAAGLDAVSGAVDLDRLE